MDFKRVFWLVLFGISGSISWAQTDSTDLNFYAAPFVPASQEDSLQYGTGDLSTLHLEFTISDIAGFGKIWVEVIRISPEGTENSIYYASFLMSDLTAMGAVSGGNVSLDLAVVETADNYRISIRIEDHKGHEKISIVKSIEE